MSHRVAINAQINPDYPGGVETNITSLLSAMKDGEGEFDVAALAIPKLTQKFQSFVSGKVNVERWALGQDAIPREIPKLARAGWLRNCLGPYKYVFDDLVRNYRQVKYKIPKPPGKKEIDRELDKLRIELVHFPSPQYFYTDRPFIYEPWDLQYLHYPEFFTKDEFEWRDYAYRKGCKKATLVVTATQWVKQDIIRHYRIAPEKIAVIHRGSDLAAAPMTEERIRKLLAAAHVEKDFIFYPAMTFEHKNHLRLLSALARLRVHHNKRIQLVLTGKNHTPFSPVVNAKVKELKLENDVLFLGRVSDEMLTGLFRSARLMIFPSLFEGLGLPLLEAFRNRTPVLAAAETCIPEVVGDAAVLFDARDVDAIAGVLANALDNPEMLTALQPLAEKRLEEFSWVRAAPAFRVCYKSALGQTLSPDEQTLYDKLVS